MTIAAKRDFEIVSSGKSVPAQVLIYAPEEIDDVHWGCEYELKGFSNSRRRKIFGVDGYQALLMALKTLCTEISISEEYKSGKLALFGEHNFDITELMGFAPVKGDPQ